MMWEQDRSAARGMMTCRGLYVFSHATPLGDAPAHKLFEHLDVHARAAWKSRAASRTTPSPRRPRRRCPPGITLSPLVEG